MIYKDYKGKKLSGLGFGCMRFPVIEGDNANIDKEKTAQMIDIAMKNGINYYDTAWAYHSGQSERVMGEILAKYPRDSFYLATKFPGYDSSCFEDPSAIFEKQLERTYSMPGSELLTKYDGEDEIPVDQIYNFELDMDQVWKDGLKEGLLGIYFMLVDEDGEEIEITDEDDPLPEEIPASDAEDDIAGELVTDWECSKLDYFYEKPAPDPVSDSERDEYLEIEGENDGDQKEDITVE